MTLIEKHIVKTYSSLLSRFSRDAKLGLIGNLTKSLKSEKKTRDDEKFYKLFGSLASDEDFGDSFSGLKSARLFRKKEIEF